MKPPAPHRRRFTGWHMTAILVAFFGTVVAVNLTMARFAIGSFGGTVVDNSYVASQKYNGWLEQARAQEALGWSVGDPVRDSGSITLPLAIGEVPLTGALVAARIEHPLGRRPAQDVRFAEAAPGRYHAIEPVAPGRWRMTVTVDRGGERYVAIRDLR